MRNILLIACGKVWEGLCIAYVQAGVLLTGLGTFVVGTVCKWQSFTSSLPTFYPGLSTTQTRSFAPVRTHSFHTFHTTNKSDYKITLPNY